MTITKDIRYIGVNDHAVDLFEDSTLSRAACATIPTPSWTKRSPLWTP